MPVGNHANVGRDRLGRLVVEEESVIDQRLDLSFDVSEELQAGITDHFELVIDVDYLVNLLVEWQGSDLLDAFLSVVFANIEKVESDAFELVHFNGFALGLNGRKEEILAFFHALVTSLNSILNTL